MRKIIHVDMDAFYASVEQRDHAARYAGRPIAVGGRPPRGVVMAASYEARPAGVRSAMPAAEAKRRCPALIFVKPRMGVYKQVSGHIRRILRRYTDLIEPLSLDEAYLDVTSPKLGPPSGTLIAERIRAEIRETMGLTASAGVASGKFVAKVASDRHKPDELTVVPPEAEPTFIAGLPIEAFHGVGPVTAGRMRRLGICRGAGLQEASEEWLVHHFGRRGHFFYRIAHGRDRRTVRPNRERKSVGAERTFASNTADPGELRSRLRPIAERVAARLERVGRQGRTVTLKIKTYDHDVSTRQETLPRAVSEAPDLKALGEHLMGRPAPPRDPVRLLGLSVSNLSKRETEPVPRQLALGLD